MSSKFICPQCERKFIDWGAEKLDFKCPDCEDMELKAIGFEPAVKAKKKKPTLKRKKKAAAKPKAKAKKSKVASEDDVLAADGGGQEAEASELE